MFVLLLPANGVAVVAGFERTGIAWRDMCKHVIETAGKSGSQTSECLYIPNRNIQHRQTEPGFDLCGGFQHTHKQWAWAKCSSEL